MFYTPTNFLYIIAEVLKEDNTEYSSLLSTTYFNIGSSEFSMLGAVYRIMEHIYYLMSI
jgi:hypothetical protein